VRLRQATAGRGLKQKLIFAIIRLTTGARAPDVVRTIFHDMEFVGGPFHRATEGALRGPSVWSVGERELFAAFVSRLNECRF
jgi:hypothetical protein